MAETNFVVSKDLDWKVATVENLDYISDPTCNDITIYKIVLLPGPVFFPSPALPVFSI
jgi:hypothetical protein